MLFFIFFLVFFFFNDTATTEIYTLSLHDALPIFAALADRVASGCPLRRVVLVARIDRARHLRAYQSRRSEEHTSELQSHVNLVCRLLLEKKKKKTNDLRHVADSRIHRLEAQSVCP